MPAKRVLDGARLAALRDTALLDAPPDGSLERLNRLAVELLGVPVSLTSLVDADRQFFAAQVGLPEPWASDRGTPLSHSFCQHVVGSDEALVVADARSDPRTAGNLAIRDLDVIAYAGVPLRLRDGQTLGSFCAIDARPRQWSERDLRILHDLAAIAAEAIELRRARVVDPLHDPLTGLPHRLLFQELVERAGERARREGSAIAVVAADLIGFRLVNEALGHAAGDELLVAVANRLNARFRARDTVCRTEADHFMVLCESVDERGAVRVAQRVSATIGSRPYLLGTEPLHLGAKVGYALSSDAPGAEQLLQAAAAAALEQEDARIPPQRGRPARASTRLRIRSDLAGAQRRGEFDLAYQPIVALDDERIAGFEALVRWDHPELGSVPPDQFIPIAEASGAIVTLGEWTLRRACAQLARWRRHPHGAELTIAVNIAPVQLRVPTFADTVAAALARAGLPPTALTLEVTERTLLEERRSHREAIDALRATGVRIVLDDFGTGYSALDYLNRFPLDGLKIDRSFTTELGREPRAAAIVSGVLAIADGLGLSAVAEGIESATQLAELRRLGCRLGQGYRFGRPVRQADAPLPGPVAAAALERAS